MIDLHTHTIHSDGSRTVSELLELANKQNLEILSITDHDSVGAYRELCDPKIRGIFSGKIITGVELSAAYNGEFIEVLGYNIDTKIMGEFIKKNVHPFTDTIEDQSRIYMSTLKKYGVRFDNDFVKLITESPEKVFAKRKAFSQGVYLEQMRKYPENAEFFKDEQEFNNISVTDFIRFYVYNPKSSLYVDLSPLFLSLSAAIEAIHKSGGLAFLAHPFVYSKTIADSLEKMYSDYDLDGIECFYPTFTKAQSEFLYSFAKKHNLYTSCGSDFHGLDVKPNNHIGHGTEYEIMTADKINWE